MPGLNTTALPAMSEGMHIQCGIDMGKFHGVMTPTTPSGSWWTVERTPPDSTTSGWSASAISSSSRSSPDDSDPASMRDSRSGLPISRVMSSACSSVRAAKTSRARPRTSARPCGPSAPQSGWAARARRTRAGISSTDVSGTSPTRSPWAGSKEHREGMGRGLAWSGSGVQLGTANEQCRGANGEGKVTSIGEVELFEAARAGDRREVLRRIDEVPGRMTERDASGASLLHVAAELDDDVLARELLRRGADQEVEAPWGQTPFEWAANLGSSRVAELLLERDARRHSLWTAAALGRLDDVEARLAAAGAGLGRKPPPGANPTGWPEQTAYRRGDALSDALYIACRNGHLEVARALHGAGADPDAGASGAKTWTVRTGDGPHADVVRWLAATGADTAARDPKYDATPAGWAREGGHEALARFLEGYAGDAR